MDSAQIEMRDVQAHGGDVVRQLLAETVCQPRKAPRCHPHAEIAALDIRRTDAALIADQPMPPYPYYYARRIAACGIDRRLAVVLLDYLGVGAIRPE
jgi:hypothetical protein